MLPSYLGINSKAKKDEPALNRESKSAPVATFHTTTKEKEKRETSGQLS
jgi:hypothetical protein